jgi:hypothetical protein
MTESNKPSFATHLTSSEKVGRISLVWENIEMSMVVADTENSTFFRRAKKAKRIIRGVSGKAVSGELLAIMGPTGTIVWR